MEALATFSNLHHHSAISWSQRIPANTMEAYGGNALLCKKKKQKTEEKHNMSSFCSFGVIRVSGRLGSKICLKMVMLTPCFSAKLSTVASWTEATFKLALSSLASYLT